MPLDLQSIINYLLGLAWAKSLGEERDREAEKKEKEQKRERKSSTDIERKGWWKVGETGRQERGRAMKIDKKEWKWD